MPTRGAGDMRARRSRAGGEVVDQQPAGQAGAEAQREGAEQDRRDRSVHASGGAGLAAARGAAAARTAGPGTARPAAGRCRRATRTRTRPASSAPSGALRPRVRRLHRRRRRSPDSYAVARLGQLGLRIRAEQPDRSRRSAGSPSSSAARRSRRAARARLRRRPHRRRLPGRRLPSNAARRSSGGVRPSSAAASAIRSRSGEDVAPPVVERLARLVELPRTQLGADVPRQLPVVGGGHGGGVGLARRLRAASCRCWSVLTTHSRHRSLVRGAGRASRAGRAAAASRPGRTHAALRPARRAWAAGRPSRHRAPPATPSAGRPRRSARR